MDDIVDVDAVIAHLEPRWLEGLVGEDLDAGKRAISWLVGDFAAEADRAREPGAVLQIQLDDLDKLRPHGQPEQRLVALRSYVVYRQLERLGVKTLALGTAVVSGSISDEQAESEGRSLLDQAESLGAEVRVLPPSPTVDAARRELSDVVMEALYAVERKAMSGRLARATDDESGPPGLRP